MPDAMLAGSIAGVTSFAVLGWVLLGTLPPSYSLAAWLLIAAGVAFGIVAVGRYLQLRKLDK